MARKAPSGNRFSAAVKQVKAYFTRPIWRDNQQKSGTKKQNVTYQRMAYIQSTFNNSIVTIADQNGDVISGHQLVPVALGAS